MMHDTMKMRGAYCLMCGADGPDLAIDTEPAYTLPAGIRAHVRFTCGNCQRRCVWVIHRTDKGVFYTPVVHSDEELDMVGAMNLPAAVHANECSCRYCRAALAALLDGRGR